MQLEQVDRPVGLVGGVRQPPRARDAGLARRRAAARRRPRAGALSRRPPDAPVSPHPRRPRCWRRALRCRGSRARPERSEGLLERDLARRLDRPHARRARMRAPPEGDRAAAHAALADGVRGGRRSGPVRAPHRVAAGRAGALERARGRGGRGRAGGGGRSRPLFRRTGDRALVEHPRPEVRDAALVAAAASGGPRRSPASPMRRASTPRRSRCCAGPPPLAFRTLGRFEVRRGAWVVDAGRLGAEGRRAGRAPAARPRRRPGSRGRAGRGVLARTSRPARRAAGCRPRSRAPAPCSTCPGSRAACAPRSAPTRSSCARATARRHRFRGRGRAGARR